MRIDRRRRASNSWATRGGEKNHLSSGNGEQPVIEVPSLAKELSSRGVGSVEGTASARCPHWVRGCRHAGLYPSEDWWLKEGTNTPAKGFKSVSAGHLRKSKSCDEIENYERNEIDDYYVNDNDENDLNENELSENGSNKLVGIWGNVLSNACRHIKCFEQQMELDTSAPAEAAPILIAEGKQGNQILTPLFQLSRDKLWIRDDNINNFSSCDGVLTTPVRRELSDNSIIKISDLKEINAELGYVSSTMHGKYFVYNLFIKETFDAKVFAKNIEKAISKLREAMEAAIIKSISISREGNGFDKMSWSIIERIFRTHFGKSDFKITVGTGKVQIPAEEQRLEIIRESHDSTVGGYKGENKTLARVWERFYWKRNQGIRKNMQNVSEAKINKNQNKNANAYHGCP